MNKLDIQAVIFDMDGLLFDSERFGYEVWRMAEEHFGFTGSRPLADRIVGTFVDEEEMLRLHVEYLGEELGPKVRRWRREQYLARHPHFHPDPKPGARELLDFLRARHIPRALATSSGPDRVAQYFAGAGLPCDFDAVITGEMVAHSKPAPDIYLEAARGLGVDISHCAILEDSANGVRGARAAGGYVVMVPDMIPPDRELRALADQVVEDLVQARRLLFGK